MEDQNWGFGPGMARTQYVTVGATLTPFVPRADKRRAIIFSAPTAGTLSLYWDNTPGANPGIIIQPTNHPVVLSRALYGSLVTGPINAIASVGGTVCTYAEEAWL